MREVAWIRLSLIAAALWMTACGGDDRRSSADAGADSPSNDAGGGDAGDAGPMHDAGVAEDAGGSGAACVFNDDCPAAERCECDEATGCFCRTGMRGTGVSGVDTCTDGNDCATSLCVEGSDGMFYCSGPCATDMDCGPALPRCIDVATLGRICARAAP